MGAIKEAAARCDGVAAAAGAIGALKRKVDGRGLGSVKGGDDPL